MNGLIVDNQTDNVKIAVGSHNDVDVAIDNLGEVVGLFHSPDGGVTWQSLDLPVTIDGCAAFGLHPGKQGNIHLSIVADPANANLIYVAGDRQPLENENGNCGPESFPNSLGATDFTGREFRINAALAPGNQVANLTDAVVAAFPGGGTANKTGPHADSRAMVFDSNGSILEVDDGGIYRRTSPQSNLGDWFALD